MQNFKTHKKINSLGIDRSYIDCTNIVTVYYILEPISINLKFVENIIFDELKNDN